MIILYYGEEGEVFMTFHDESQLDCLLLPTEFSQLFRNPVERKSDGALICYNNISQTVKSKSKLKQLTDERVENSKSEPKVMLEIRKVTLLGTDCKDAVNPAHSTFVYLIKEHSNCSMTSKLSIINTSISMKRCKPKIKLQPEYGSTAVQLDRTIKITNSSKKSRKQVDDAKVY